ncbi:putative NAD(P)-binding protein [Seiridium unicorne]|uniref:NAD(P)-binding protein n=1 Tax=Seiridium unicorne TaxID=138068 RepID=A0ABR2VIP3_9PEZI
MPTAIVTGANSGIGHEFAKLLIQEGYDVHAVDVNYGPELRSLSCETSQLDVSSPNSIDSFAKSFGDGPLDLLLNIAGVMATHESDALETVDQATLQRVFAVNTFGPLLLTQALLPNLLKSKDPKVGVMSSRVGSIGDNSTGGMYAYRSSKAAVNAVCKSMSVDLKEKGVVVVILHPGFVKTGLDPSTHGLKEAVEADEAAAKLWQVLREKKLEDTGRFWHREGTELPW